MTTRQLNRINEKVVTAYQSQLASFLTDQKNVAKLIAFLASVGFTISMGDSSMLFPMLTGASGFAVCSSVSKAVKEAGEFSLEYKRQLMRDTDEYYNCVELYDSVITDIANFLRGLGFKDSLDIGLFYQELLYNGFLSAPGSFEYHKYSYDNGICPEIYGARVSSGAGVCRHIASHLKDIYEKMGFTASYLSVGGASCTLVSKIKTRIMPSSINHAVVCVKDHYGKFIIDPTWEKVAVFDRDDNFAHIIGDNTKDKRYVVGYATLIDRKRLTRYDGYVGVRASASATLTNEDVYGSYDYIHDIFCQRRTEIVQFYYYIKKRLEMINYYEQQLARCTDVNSCDRGKVLRRR